MMRLEPQNEEVLLASGDVVALGPDEIETLKARLPSAPRGRYRICAHAGPDAPLHEMLLVLDRDTYVRPHRHPGKTESFHVVEGAADIVIFDEHGEILEVVRMGDRDSGRSFYYRLNAPHFHTVLVRSSQFVVHETTNGPFNREETEEASWAPDESDTAGREAFLGKLESAVGERSGVRGGNELD